MKFRILKPFYLNNLLQGCMVIFLILSFTTLASQSSKRDTLLSEIEEIRNSSNFNSKDTLYIHNLIALAYEYRFHNLDSLYTLSQKNLALSKKAEYTNGEISSYHSMGGYYSDKGKIDQAIIYFNKAYKLAEKYENNFLKVRTLNDLAKEYGY